MTPISKILVAVDFSENSNRALATAIDLAGKFEASIDLVHAFASLIPAIYPYDIGIPDALMRDARNSAKEMLQADSDKVHAAHIVVRTHLTEVPAAGAIARVAEEVGADLLVVGTRGHSGLKHILMGSVAERTIREAPCSVLVVK
jgi:universal stress protein A